MNKQFFRKLTNSSGAKKSRSFVLVPPVFYRNEFGLRWGWKLLIILAAFLILLAAYSFFYEREPEPEMVSPVPEVKDSEIVKDPFVASEYLEGMASWYGTGENECLGCNLRRIMANGQRLDDTKLTVACGVGGSCKTFPLGSKVKILNLDNYMIVEAIVTDTGGFSKYNRILDVSKAVKNRLNMEGLAEVRVSLIN